MQKKQALKNKVALFINRLLWLGGIAFVSRASDFRLGLVSIPATLALWYFRDVRSAKAYHGVKSGEIRNFRKCTDSEVDAFLEGVGASKSYLNQFLACHPRSITWQHHAYYDAGMAAALEADEQFIDMMEAIKRNRPR